MAVTFTPPKQWEDWCDWALGIWLVLSPWVLLFEKDTLATRNAVIGRAACIHRVSVSCVRPGRLKQCHLSPTGAMINEMKAARQKLQ